MHSTPRLYLRHKFPFAIKTAFQPKKEMPDDEGISIPGFQRIMRPTNSICKRILWTVVVGICLSTCVWLLYIKISLYLCAPTFLDPDPAWNKSVSFPAITLCPVQEPFDANSVYYNWLVKHAKLHNTSSNVSVDDYESVPFRQLNLTLGDVWNESAIPDDRISIFASCEMTNDENRTCNYQEGVRTFLKNETYETLWGLCRLFIPEFPIDYRGPATFLMVILNGSQHDKIHNFTGIKYTAKYIIHDRESTHRHDAYLLSNCLSTGWQNSVKLVVKEFHFLNTPRRACDTADSTIKCRDSYMDNLLTDELKCSLPFIKNDRLGECDSWKAAKEAYNKTKKIYNYMTFDKCTCKSRCQETIYINHVVKIQLNNQPDKTILSLEFADSHFENVTEVYVYSLSSLLSDIAAFLGFFLGICILSIFELLESILAKVANWKTKA